MQKVMAIVLSSITLLGMSIPVFAADTDEGKYTIQITSDLFDPVDPAVIATNTAKDRSKNVTIKGKSVDLGEHGVVISNGKVMVPLKTTAESLGFTVNIDNDNKTVLLENTGIKTSITVGEDNYYYSYSNGSYIACGKSVSVGAAPMIIDNVIYVSIKVFNVFFNDQNAVGSFWCKTKDGQTIYVDKGELTTGWKLIENKWFFMNSNGIMQRGWVESNGNWYYAYDNGEVAINTITPDGYKVDQSGKWDLEKAVSNKDDSNKVIGAGNPIEDYKTVEEAQKVLKFKITLPKEVPSQFAIKYIETISRNAFQIDYSNGEKDILFRMEQDIDNISGDYNKYENNDIINLDGKDVKLSGKNNLINVATWKINNMSYSISVKSGMEKIDIIKIIESTF